MFMNPVHEQCPKVDSGKIPSQIGSKTGRVHRVHSPRPGCAPSAQAARLPPSQPCPARSALARALPPARLPLLPRTPRAPRAPLPPARPTHAPRALRTQRLPSSLALKSQYNFFVLRYKRPAFKPALVTIQLHCIVTPLLSPIRPHVAIQFQPTTHLSCNTIPLPSSLFLAILFPTLQYKSSSQYNLGSSPINFFFVFHYK